MRILIICICFICSFGLEAQTGPDLQRISNNLELLSVENAGLTEKLKVNINVTNVSLPNFLLAVSEIHKVNINIEPSLQNITIVNNFSDVTVADLFLFLCKEYELDIAFTGNILSFKKYENPPPAVIEKEIRASYDAINNLISLDLNKDALDKVFRKIMDSSGQNLLYNNGMENLPLTLYLQNVPFDAAMQKIAETNGLQFNKSRDGFYLFSKIGPDAQLPDGTIQSTKRISNGANFYYEVIDTLQQKLTVDFNQVPIADIIHTISRDLKLDVYTATPLDTAGEISFVAKEIYFDTLLERIFESKSKSSPPAQSSQTANQPNRNPNSTAQNSVPQHFTFKKENDVYFFGTADQLSVRKIEVIQLMHRSVELLGDPVQNNSFNRSAGRTVGGNINYLGGNQNSFQGNQGNRNSAGFNNNNSRINTQSESFGNYGSRGEALVNILPDDLKKDLDIQIDFELNSFLVSGPAANINRFKEFVKQIDRPVPVVLIEVMLIEVKKTASVETGISWGIGDESVKTTGSVFPSADITLGAKTVNKIIGGFDGFGSFNIGKVVPEFFVKIKALEESGNIKIRSTPKLSTLNGHRAHLSIGETTYYVVTNQSFFGSQVPTSSEIRNYQPIDAQLAVSIKPLVSGNGQVTLDIAVIQSDFSSERIEDDAPPGLTSREFSSIIRMQNQDLAILGGLEEKVKNDSGSGVPFLARVPVIKWLFSKRKREDSKQKLTILIKPTVIY